MNNKIILSSLLIITIIITGCKKYEDGPVFSLLSKKQRLTGEWEATSIQRNGQNTLLDNENSFVPSVNADSTVIQSFYTSKFELEFDSDGDCNLTETVYIFGEITWSLGGKWKFSNDKEEIEIDWETVNGQVIEERAEQEMEIIRLTNKELVVEYYSDDGDFIEIEMEKN